MASSGAFGSSGLPAAPSGRLAAAAAHRAALRDVDVDTGAVDSGSCESERDQAHGCSPIRVIGIDAIGVSLLSGEKTYRLYNAIGDIETFDDSRLRRKFASCQCVAQCKASVVHSHYGPEHLCDAKGKKRSSALSASAKQPQKVRLESIRLLYVGKAATEEP